MNFDLVYQEIGNLGRYQKYILVLSGFTSFYAGLLFISSFFTLAIPKHRLVFHIFPVLTQSDIIRIFNAC